MRVVYLENNIVVHAIIAHEADENGMLVDDNISIGMTYDSELNKFFRDAPFPSWVKDGNTQSDLGEWVAPTPKPEPDSDGDDRMWQWVEDTTSWVTV